MEDNVNIENNVQESDNLISASQPNLPSQSLGSNKRSLPDSPDNLPATQRQVTRQIRRRNSLGDLRDINPSQKKVPASKKSIADKVLEALSSPDVLQQIIPILSQKICENIESMIETQIQDCVQTQIKPLMETVRSQQVTIDDLKEKTCKQFITIHGLERGMADQIRSLKEHEKEIEALYSKIGELEVRLESQEQYSRRTSLRFHNLTVPVNDRGFIKHPVNTDQLVLDVCNTKMGLELTEADISRYHVIGQVRNGKSQVIVRFISYRTRHMVYSRKKFLKNDTNGIFITENLTQYRTTLVKKLAQLKYRDQIHAYWTSDGRIFAMKSENSRKKIINNFNDIRFIERMEHVEHEHQDADLDVSLESEQHTPE